MEHITSICVLRLTSFGDVLLVSPLVRILRTTFPNVAISLITTAQCEVFFRYNPHVSSIFILNKKASPAENTSFLQEMISGNGGRFDVLIDLQNNLRTLRFRRRIARTILTLQKLRLAKIALVYAHYDIFPAGHSVVKRYIQTAQLLGLEPDSLGVEFWLPKDTVEQSYNTSLLKQQQQRFTIFSQQKILKIAVAPGAKHFTKKLPLDILCSAIAHIAASILSKKIDVHFILLGGPDEVSDCEKLQSMLGSSYSIENFAGKTSLDQVAELLDTCFLALTNDSSLMHVASARQIPIVAFFGSTVRQFGFAPFGVPFRIIETDITCRPCTHIGRTSCPKKHFSCMKEISPKEIASAANELLSSVFPSLLHNCEPSQIQTDESQIV